MTIDETSGVPIHYQLTKRLRDSILHGELKPGSQIPSGSELCRQHGVSRGTARQAVQALVREGLAYRRRGVGTFVSRPRVVMRTFDHFAQDLAAQGYRVSCELIDYQKVHPEPRARRDLQLDRSELVHRIVRVLYGNDDPFMMSTVQLPVSCIEKLQRSELTCIPIWDIWLDKYPAYNPGFSTCETTMAMLPDKYESEVLRIPEASPVFLVKRIVHGLKNPFFVDEIVVRGDRCSYYVEYSSANIAGRPRATFTILRE